jgi:oxygen-independent coproporphyrinogen-3 oxidase
LPDEDAAASMQARLEERLLDAGYAHYETSAFAKVRHRCRHNLNYWMFGDYLGIGAGAHGKLSFHDRIVRYMRIKHPVQYMRSVMDSGPIAEERILTRKDMPFEFMMNAMRLNEGVQPELFTQRTGMPVHVLNRPLELAKRKGLIETMDEVLRPTLLGRRFLNDLVSLFLPI